LTDAVAKPAATAIPKPPTKSMGAWALDILIWGGVGAVLVYSFGPVALANVTKLFGNNENTQNFARELLRPDFANWKLFVAKMWETVQIALWGTFIAVFAAIPMGLAAARNIAPAWVVTPVRWVMNLLRSIPDLVIGLLFVVAVGLGPLPGVLAIALNTAGVLAKLFSEAVESISRSATVLGLIGAGGIGQVLFDSMNAFDFRAVSAIVIVVVVAVTLIDMLSQAMRKRLL
jgi:phosphonate transport system permease protein